MARYRKPIRRIIAENIGGINVLVWMSAAALLVGKMAMWWPDMPWIIVLGFWICAFVLDYFEKRLPKSWLDEI